MSKRPRRLLFCALALVSAGASAELSPAPGPAARTTGRVEGRVTLGARLSSTPMRFTLYPDVHRAELRREEPGATAELENVVVYIEAVPDDAWAERRPTGPVRMAQRDLTFEPHVLAVVRGTTVEFPNQDTLFHNVFSLSKAASFDLGRYPNGDSRTLELTKPGIIKVFCHIHSDMSGVIVVLDNPFFAQPDAQGRFAIDGLPPGEYRVAAWHERARLATSRVKIEAGRAARLDFSIPLEEQDGG